MDTRTIHHARKGDTSPSEAIMDLETRVIRSPRLPYTPVRSEISALGPEIAGTVPILKK